MTTWRTGRKLGRTLYRDDKCVGIVDTPEIAAEIVSACNATRAEERIEELERALRLALEQLAAERRLQDGL